MRNPRLLGWSALSVGALVASFFVFKAARQPAVDETPAPSTPALSAPERGGLSGGAPMGAATPRTVGAEELQDDLQRQVEDLGIQSLGKEDEAPSSFLGEHLGQPGTREQAEAHIRRFAALRRGVEAAKDKPVPIEGRTAPLLSESSAGGALVPETPEPGVWTGSYGAAEPGARVIADDKAWKAAWESLGVLKAPYIDFSKHHAAAVFLGPRPTGGYRVAISPVVEVKGVLVVRWRETGPPPGRAPPEGASAPYALRLFPKSALPVRFIKD